MILPFLALVATATLAQTPSELYDYLARPDDSFRYEISRGNPLETRISMTSQTWQGIPWEHTILLHQPPRPAGKGVAVLYITGDGPRPADYLDISLIAGSTNLPVATLFNTPNQPIWEMKEDDLIAHTFQKYLETGDGSWPLLFPMTKGAIRAMDAVQAATKDSDNPIERFVVAGASKRGWTTWFVGASKDPRVVGIAPLVIDNLNVEKQMPHQLASWGKYSEQIEEYTRRGLQAQLETPQGRILARMIDPYHYRANITMPTLIVNGANDPYWAVDALSMYWDDLSQPKWAAIVPNAGHDLGGLEGKRQALEAFGAFARSFAGDGTMPDLQWSLVDEGVANGTRTLTIGAQSSLPISELRVLTAVADDLDFRPVRWEPVGALRLDGDAPPDSGTSNPRLRFSIPTARNVAVLAEVTYRVSGRTFKLSRPVQVFRK
jgi:PhoPQ-activated pathogenicity-related protein